MDMRYPRGATLQHLSVHKHGKTVLVLCRVTCGASNLVYLSGVHGRWGDNLVLENKVTHGDNDSEERVGTRRELKTAIDSGVHHVY